MPVKPKYRRLSAEELKPLEKEFVEYLIVNGIVAEEWEKLKADEPDKTEDIIVLFSDVVFEGIMRKTLFLDHISQNEVLTFQCLAEKIVLVGIKSSNPAHDFTNPGFTAKAIQNPPKGLKVYTTEKKYSKIREVELFEMTQAGCTISDGKLFKALSLSLV